MNPRPFSLLQTRRFLPLFITQFLGAFNDNAFKNALVILITYVLAERTGLNSQLMVTAAAGIFILPFFLFSATAGQLADAYEKVYLIRIVKFIEIVLMGGAAYGFLIESPFLLMLILFLMGAQSTFFGPIKYGILPEKLAEDELIAGNGLIEAGTFAAILVGTIVGGLLVLVPDGIYWVSGLVIAVAFAGWMASAFIPPGVAADPSLKIDFNFIRETWAIVAYARGRRDVFLSILGISWFWLVGATFLAQFPTYSKDIIGGDEQLVTLFLTVFTLGVGLGSLLCNQLLRGSITATYVPLGVLGVSVFTLDLYFASQHTFHASGGTLIGAVDFLSHLSSWRLLLDLFLISVFSGVYIVPLYAIMQSRTETSHRSRTIAGNNIINALFMVISAVGTALMLALGFSVTEVFLTIALLNTLVAAYICKLLPDALIKSFLQWIFRSLYRVEIHGWDNYRKLDGLPAILVANHLSFLDAPLIAAFIPDKPVFAINTQIARKFWMRPVSSLIDTFPMDPSNPMATRSLIERVREGQKVVIFPEGRITVTGSLMKVYDGPGMIAEKSGARILPVRIDGAQYTPFSRLKGKVRIRWFPRISITFLEPRSFDLPEEVKGQKRRRLAGSRLYDLMTDMIFRTSSRNQTLFQSLLEARSIHSPNHVILEDIQREPMTYHQLVTKSFVLGKALAGIARTEENTGVLLANSLAAVVTFFGLQAYGRVPAMLNYSTGRHNLLSACATAEIKTIITSRRFVELGELQNLIDALQEADLRIVYLEDLAAGISWAAKITGALAAWAPKTCYRFFTPNPNPASPAVVLFTSGSEGLPKGVVLSHLNLQANRCQTTSRFDFGPADTVFNALPIFHSFGLTGGTLLPVLEGVRCFQYPSPLHYRIIPEMSYDVDATIIFGTDTFLAGYAQYSHPYNFYSLRYVFAGAERLKPETARLWLEKFGHRILEGYGATETAPILSLNTRMQYKAGSVGRFLPGIEYRLENVPGIDSGGRLFVSGPNVMLGYLKPDQPGKLQPLPDKWYDTGDIVEVDDEGFITIKGRVRRFAKVGGEMISLSAVEGQIANLWPQKLHAVISLPDDKKGEKLVLVTEFRDARREDLVAHARQSGLGELGIPKTIRIVEKIPLLATGKIDYVRVRELVEEPEP